MRTFPYAAVGVAAMLILILHVPIHAQASLSPAAPHVRALTADARALIDSGSERSPLIRALLDRLAASDVVVSVDFHWFADSLSGRLAFVGRAAETRYVLIRLAAYCAVICLQL